MATSFSCPAMAVFYGPQFVIVEWDLLPEPKQVCFRLNTLSLAGFFGHVEVAASAGHAVRALIKEVVRTIAVSDVV